MDFFLATIAIFLELLFKTNLSETFDNCNWAYINTKSFSENCISLSLIAEHEYQQFCFICSLSSISKSKQCYDHFIFYVLIDSCCSLNPSLHDGRSWQLLYVTEWWQLLVSLLCDCELICLAGTLIACYFHDHSKMLFIKLYMIGACKDLARKDDLSVRCRPWNLDQVLQKHLVLAIPSTANITP